MADLPELRRLAGNWFILPAGDERTSAYLAFSSALVEAWPEIEAALGHPPAKLTEAAQGTEARYWIEKLIRDLESPESQPHLGCLSPVQWALVTRGLRALLAEGQERGEPAAQFWRKQIEEFQDALQTERARSLNEAAQIAERFVTNRDGEDAALVYRVADKIAQGIRALAAAPDVQEGRG